MLIAYCDKCGFRVPDSDLETGAASKTGDNTYVCAKCSASAEPKKPPTKHGIKPIETTTAPSGRRISGAVKLPNLQNETVTTSSGRPGSGPVKLPTGPNAAATRSTAPAKTRREDQSSSMPIILAAAGAALVLVIVLVASSGRKPEVAEKAPPKEAPKESKNVTPPLQNTPGQVSNDPRNVTPPVNPPVAANAGAVSGNDGNVSVLDTAARLKKADQEMEAIRNAQAAKTLSEIKSWYAANKSEGLKYKSKLSAFVDKSKSTPAALEAAKLLEEIQLPDDTNLVPEPGFESGKWGPWTQWGTTQVGKDPNHAKSGKHHAVLQKNNAGVGQTIKGLTPNGKYVLTAWVKASEGTTVYIGVKDHGNPDTNKTTKDDTYQRVVVPFTMGAKDSALIYAHIETGVAAHVDDFSLLVESAATATVSGGTTSTPPTPTTKTDDAPGDLLSGLWAGGFLPVDNDGLKSSFRQFKGARVAKNLRMELTHTPPESMPGNNFGIKLQGIIRVAENGKYRFKAKGDDRLILYIDGTKILTSDNREAEAEITLTRGDHAFKGLLTQLGGRWGCYVQWKTPNSNEFQDIPEAVLFHDPKQIDVYKQLEKE